MLNDVAFGTFLEQPPRKCAPPFLVISLHVQLNKSPGFRHFFPGSGGLTGTQADNSLAHAQRLAGLHIKVSGKTVALVKKAYNSFPFGHGRAGQFGNLLPVRQAGGVFELHRTFIGLIIGRQLITAAGKKHGGQDHPRQLNPHDASGLQAS